MSLSHFAPNPDYGSGIYRRLVRIVVRPQATLASIDDTHHAMWVLLHHRGGLVTGVDGAIERGPATSCGQAAAGLAAVEGMAVRATNSEITARLSPSENCTHLGDLLRWAFRHCERETVEYRIAVPDEGAEPIWMEVMRGERIVHRWLVSGETILAPETVAGRPLLRGFHRWASEIFDADDLEAALMLQRGAWVARGRRYLVDHEIVPLRDAAGMESACFSYSGHNWATATNNLHYVRDFTRGVVEHPLPPRVRKITGENGHEAA